MDLCGPMRVKSVNGKNYILVIVDDYSRFTWVKFLRSKDQTLIFIIKFLKMIQVGISHETSVARSSQQNGVIERRNRTLIEAACTMLIYAQAPLFLWAETVATAYFTQNQSIIRLRYGKTPYELLHSKLPDLSFFHVFGALCYPTNDSENLGKLQPKANIGIFIGYAPTKKAFRIYNRRTRRIVETIHVDFDELTAMASEQSRNVCPLTRIAIATIMPPREPIPIVNDMDKPVVTLVVQIVFWYLDSGCSKHMTGDRSQLINFVQKFLGTVKIGNDHAAKIMGQFCDSDLEVAFRQHTCFIRNLDGVDLLTGYRGNNLYTLSLQDMMASSPICLLSKASKTKSWLWHRRLSHLNFGAINHLARQGLVRGLPKLKFEKDHLCSACAMGKSTKKTHKPKSEDTNQEKLYLLHMDLCGPMRVESINGKKFILVIVDDYSRFTWVKFLRSKDETSMFIIKFLKMI
nr:hypothetical protein [Tanacetum cinerariifolium]